MCPRVVHRKIRFVYKKHSLPTELQCCCCGLSTFVPRRQVFVSSLITYVQVIFLVVMFPHALLHPGQFVRHGHKLGGSFSDLLVIEELFQARPCLAFVHAGFYDECKRRYTVKLWRVFSDCFNCMPVAAIVEDKILCMHGGISPELQRLGQILEIPRPIDVPDEGLLCDLLWSDPEAGICGYVSLIPSFPYS